jgi:hypothetical protein
MTTNIDDLSPEERDRVLSRLRERGGADAPAMGAAEASVVLEVTGGMPGERYSYRVGVQGDGKAERLRLDELRGVEENVATTEVDADLVRQVFRAADNAGLLDDSAPELASQQLVPDSMVAVLTVREGGAARRVAMPASEPTAGEPDFSGEPAELPLETPMQVPAAPAGRIRPVLDALHAVELELPR